MEKLSDILEHIKKCNICSKFLPFVPRPVLQAGARAKLLIIGQAPGSKAHHSMV